MSKFKVDDVVQMVNPICNFEVGKIVEVTEVYNEGSSNEHYRIDSHEDYWWCDDDDIKLVVEEPYVNSLQDHKPVHIPEDTVENDNPNGGPAGYYDIEFPFQTANDYIEAKSKSQWLEHSWHLANIFKAGFRWGTKGGTTKLYDARKIVYSGLRLILMLEGLSEVQKYLKELSEDKQFKE